VFLDSGIQNKNGFTWNRYWEEENGFEKLASSLFSLLCFFREGPFS
jgi:hypothetical protein